MHIDSFPGTLCPARPEPRPILLMVLMMAALLMTPRAAAAQWYVAGYLGANHTLPASVSIDTPSRLR